MPRNIHSRFSKNNLLLSVKLVFPRKLHLPSKLASRPTRKSKDFQNKNDKKAEHIPSLFSHCTAVNCRNGPISTDSEETALVSNLVCFTAK